MSFLSSCHSNFPEIGRIIFTMTIYLQLVIQIIDHTKFYIVYFLSKTCTCKDLLPFEGGGGGYKGFSGKLGPYISMLKVNFISQSLSLLK